MPKKTPTLEELDEQLNKLRQHLHEEMHRVHQLVHDRTNLVQTNTNVLVDDLRRQIKNIIVDRAMEQMLDGLIPHRASLAQRFYVIAREVQNVIGDDANVLWNIHDQLEKLENIERA